MAQLICCKTNGKELWRHDLKKDFAGTKADRWGYSESVLIDGDLLVCTPGGPTNTMVALDKLTGDTRWTTSRPEDRGAGHSSIVIANVGGTRVYVQSTGSGAMAVRANDGKLLWTFDIDKTTAVIPTPIIRDDLVFFVAGYGRGGALLKQVPGASGDIKMEVVYPLKAELSNKHGGVVLVGDYLYGDSEDRGIVWCADLMTGKVQWKSRGAGNNSASIVAADDHLYIHYADGTMTLVKASPKSFEEISHFEVPGSGDRPSWSHPVILDGKLYIREGDTITCYELPQITNPRGRVSPRRDLPSPTLPTTRFAPCGISLPLNFIPTSGVLVANGSVSISCTHTSEPGKRYVDQTTRHCSQV